MSQHTLQLRQRFDAGTQQTKIRSLNTQRHHGYLKDMLVQKFLQKHRIDLFPRALRSSSDDAHKLQE